MASLNPSLLVGTTALDAGSSHALACISWLVESGLRHRYMDPSWSYVEKQQPFAVGSVRVEALIALAPSMRPPHGLRHGGLLAIHEHRCHRVLGDPADGQSGSDEERITIGPPTTPASECRCNPSPCSQWMVATTGRYIPAATGAETVTGRRSGLAAGADDCFSLASLPDQSGSRSARISSM